MQLVVDSNILLAALLKPSITQRLLFSPSFSFLVPEFCVVEIRRQLPKFSRRMKKTTGETQQAFDVILSKVRVVPKEDYAAFKNQAISMLSDQDDWPFLALAIQLHCPIWSNDSGFQKQNICRVFTTNELMRYLSNPTHK